MNQMNCNDFLQFCNWNDLLGKMPASSSLAVHGRNDQKRVAVQARWAVPVPLRPPELGWFSNDIPVCAVQEDVLRPGSPTDGRSGRSLHRPRQWLNSRCHSLWIWIRWPKQANHPRQRYTQTETVHSSLELVIRTIFFHLKPRLIQLKFYQKP